MGAAMILPILIRPFREDDAGFVLSSWLKSYATSAWAKSVTDQALWDKRRASTLYWNGHHALVSAILRRPGTLISVAAWEEDADVLAGWMCQERRHDAVLLHYLYVRERFRRNGIATELAKALPERVLYTHRSRVVSRLPLPPHWAFDPYVLMGLDSGTDRKVQPVTLEESDAPDSQRQQEGARAEHQD
jgi:GNAT superfamily N-acetyltransferase